jgi:hypothetical protein
MLIMNRSNATYMLWAAVLGVLLCIPNFTLAQEVVVGTPSLEITVGPMLHAASLEWRLGSCSAPRSVITYEAVRSLGFSTSAAYHIMNGRRWSSILSARTGVSWFHSGRAQDSDFIWSDRVEYSRSVSEVTGDVLLATNAGLSFVRNVNHGRISGSFHAASGYARNQMTLRKQYGVQVIPENVASDLLRDLDSRYHARWTGPWVGGGMSISLPVGEVELDAQRHFRTSYSGEGEWNLRNDLMQPVSFVHGATGSGYDMELGYAVSMSSRLGLVLKARKSARSALNGYDIEFPVNGEPTRGHLGGVTSRAWTFRAVLRNRH